MQYPIVRVNFPSRIRGFSRSDYLALRVNDAIEIANEENTPVTLKGNFYPSDIDYARKKHGLTPVSTSELLSNGTVMATFIIEP